MQAILFTGFPGFLGSELLSRVLVGEADTDAVCLVQPRWAALARQRADAIARERPALAGRIRLLEGDVAAPGLGLGSTGTLRARIVEIYHLAAVYDLSVGRDLAMRVNVEGTRQVLAFAAGCAALRRLHYVSTCYVSGSFPGLFTEDMLEEGQSFNNVYEESKYLAEVEVQRAMRGGLPATIYRPAVVVGDSATGATQKYDGPYFVMQWLLRQPRIAVMPVVGDPTLTRFNVVPRDFVVDAIAYLSGRADAPGAVYGLADPEPLTVDAMLSELARATGRTMIRLPLPLALAKWSIDRVPGVYGLLRIPANAVDYFTLPTTFGTSRAQAALAGSGIRCPSFRSYAGRLVAFARAHPEVGTAAMA